MNPKIKLFLTRHFPYILLISLISLADVGVLQLVSISLMLYYFRQHKGWLAMVVMLPVTSVTTYLANQGVIPFSPPTLAIVSVLLSTLGLLPYLIDRIVYKKLPWVLQLLVLPAAANSINLYLSKGPTGAMGYIANNLVDFPWLMQWTSVVGIFGVGFLMYLFGSVAVHLITSYQNGAFDKRLLAVASAVVAILVILGVYRLDQGKEYLKNAKSVRVATITNEQTPLGEALYKSYTGVDKVIDREMSQSDPVNQTVQAAMMDFKDHFDDQKYTDVRTVIDSQFDYLMIKAQKAVDLGAKIIVLSEAEVVTVKSDEDKFISAAQKFAARNKVYFFLGIGAMIPGVTFPENPFVENKIVVIDQEGVIRDTYFKNVPVQGIDPSVPGNGKMRVLGTPYGRLSYAICYDTDFPDLIRQVGQSGADLLLVPAGDWKAISPYHTKITNIRSIENGFAQVRAVSGGLSSAVDPFGNYLASDDYFEDLDHLMIADVPMKAKSTLYTQYGDLSSHISGFVLLLSLAIMIYSYFSRMRAKRRSQVVTTS